MKLLIDNLTGEATVTIKGETMTLEDAFEMCLQASGRTLAEVQRSAGLSHPRLYNHNYRASTGRKSKFHQPPGLKTYLIAFSELGYEVSVNKVL